MARPSSAADKGDVGRQVEDGPDPEARGPARAVGPGVACVARRLRLARGVRRPGIDVRPAHDARESREPASQLYRLLDQTNYSKSTDRMLRLLNVLGCRIEPTFLCKSA